MEQQEQAVVLARDLTASVFRKEWGRWFSWTSTGIWPTNCVALRDCNHSSQEIGLFRWSLTCVYERGILLPQLQNLSQYKALFDLWETDNNLFYKDKIFTMNGRSPNSMPDFSKTVSHKHPHQALIFHYFLQDQNPCQWLLILRETESSGVVMQWKRS